MINLEPGLLIRKELVPILGPTDTPWPFVDHLRSTSLAVRVSARNRKHLDPGSSEVEHDMSLQRGRAVMPEDLKDGLRKSINALSQAIDGLQQSTAQLAKRQRVLDDRVRARNSNASPTGLSRRCASVQVPSDQLVQIALRVLKEMPARDREALVRFYVGEERPEEIQRALGITETQFRRLKSRARSRFDKLRKGEQRLHGKAENQGRGCR
jgi:DNA-directed RNA polymerase specialized sigma subunit